MDTATAFGVIIAIAAVICMFFAAPIVISSSPALAYALWIIGGFYGLGVLATIFTANND